VSQETKEVYNRGHIEPVKVLSAAQWDKQVFCAHDFGIKMRLSGMHRTLQTSAYLHYSDWGFTWFSSVPAWKCCVNAFEYDRPLPHVLSCSSFTSYLTFLRHLWRSNRIAVL